MITVITFVYRRFTKSSGRLLHTPVRWFLAQLRWLPLICIAFVAIEYATRLAVYAALGMEYQHESWISVLVYEPVKLYLFFDMFVAVLFGILSYQDLATEKERATFRSNRTWKSWKRSRMPAAIPTS